MFHKDVAKVDRDVAHVAMGYTCMFQVYVLNVSSVLDVYCKCFHLDVAKLDRDVVYMQVFQVFYTYVASVFILMFAMATHVFSSLFRSVGVRPDVRALALPQVNSK